MRPPFHPILLITLIACGSRASAATLHVPADYPTIQSCIDAAISGQDECLVAPGTYNELINFLGKAITLRSSHGPQVTTIDGTGLNGSVVSYRTAEGMDTVLDGFTITGGTGTDDDGNGLTAGGGILNLSANPTVVNCILTENRATDGGAMYNSLASIFDEPTSPTIKNCVFIKNWAVRGGGVFNDRSSPLITDCSFNENTAQSEAGGMHNLNAYSNPTVLRSTFYGNTPGGVLNAYYSVPFFYDCSFVRNMGSAMINDSSGAMIVNCTFYGNMAFAGGGMANECCQQAQTTRPVVINCVFAGNRSISELGSSMYNFTTHPRLINCTFAGNGGIAPALYNYRSNPEMANCIFWNSSPEIHNYQSAPQLRYSNIKSGLPSGAVDLGGNISSTPLFVEAANPGPDGDWDGVDDDYGDLRLQSGSPCINAGDPNFVPQPGETDLDGHARVLCGHVDMGAYEFGIGDFDCDQAVTLADFSAWPDCTSEPQNAPLLGKEGVGGGDPPQSPLIEGGGKGCEALDFEFDLDVDLRDFAAWQNLFGH